MGQIGRMYFTYDGEFGLMVTEKKFSPPHHPIHHP
jgi:hypothetical protein